MRVLVTGASGFIGKNFILSCPSHWKVDAAYRNSDNFEPFLKQNKLSHARALRLDLCSKGDVQSKFDLDQTYDLCVYFAANGDPAYSVSEPALDLSQNTLALIYLLERCKFKKFIYFSSGAVYDHLSGKVNPSSTIHPTLPYAISKMASEYYVEHFHKKGRIEAFYNARFFGAYGAYEPNRKIYSKLVRQFAIEKNPRFSIRGDGSNLIDAMYVDDTIVGIHRIIESNLHSKTFDFYSGHPLSLKQLTETAARCFGIKPEIEYFGEVPEYIQFLSNDTFMSEKLQFKPTIDLESGFRKLYEHIIR